MRVLVFAHIPPPLHGQSYMVRLMLENLGNAGPDPKQNVTLFHVNARLSDGLEDIGSWRIRKIFRLAGYILQAWWMRWKHSIDAIYYVPAPPANRGALYRDWLVLFLVFPLFKITLLHWHATGLGQWISEESSAGTLRRLEAWITRRLFSGHDLSCVLNEWGRRDIEIFAPRHIAIVANGIPDPCPDTASTILAERQERTRQRTQATAVHPALFELLYLAHATRSKGLFDALDAVALANTRLVQNQNGWRFRLTVAGAFLHREEEDIFRERISRDDLQLNSEGKVISAVIYAGHVGPGEKERLLRQSDAMCFASYYPFEGQPVSVIEALAHSLPVVLSRWRALPEMVPPSHAHLIDPASPAALAGALIALAGDQRLEGYRTFFLEHYTLAAHIQHLREAFLSVAPSA
jgi:glycosyltransferase involved in cell wall biosynthesis